MSDKIKIKILAWEKLLEKGDELVTQGIKGPNGEPGFTYDMEESMPEDRIIEVEEGCEYDYSWWSIDSSRWNICDWMIDKSKPKSKLKTAGLLIGAAVMPGGIFIAGGYLAYKKLRGKS